MRHVFRENDGEERGEKIPTELPLNRSEGESVDGEPSKAFASSVVLQGCRVVISPELSHRCPILMK